MGTLWVVIQSYPAVNVQALCWRVDSAAVVVGGSVRVLGKLMCFPVLSLRDGHLGSL